MPPVPPWVSSRSDQQGADHRRPVGAGVVAAGGPALAERRSSRRSGGRRPRPRGPACARGTRWWRRSARRPRGRRTRPRGGRRRPAAAASRAGPAMSGPATAEMTSLPLPSDAAPDPRPDLAVAEPHDPLVPHPHRAAQTPTTRRTMSARPSPQRHEVGHLHRARVGLVGRLQDEAVVDGSAGSSSPGLAGPISQRPCSGVPRSAAKQAGESNRGRQSQSTEPSRPTRAAVPVSPRTA